jgi:hypothetical protein
MRWLGVVTVTALVITLDAGVAGARTTSIGRTTSATVNCSTHNAVPFAPISVELATVGKAKVLGVSRVKGTPGVPPLTDTGKKQMAWDRPGIRPGFAQGHVLMNAHAWPDASALGNALDAKLVVGSQIRVHGRGDRVQCYRVVRHVVASPSKKLSTTYYGSDKSAPRLAILTCTGVRRGPGDWSKRAVWLAKPIP